MLKKSAKMHTEMRRESAVSSQSSVSLRALSLPGEPLWNVEATSESVISLGDLEAARAREGLAPLVPGNWNVSTRAGEDTSFVSDHDLGHELGLATDLGRAVFGDAFQGVHSDVVDDDDVGGRQLVIEALVDHTVPRDALRAKQREFLEEFMARAEPDHAPHFIVTVRRYSGSAA